MSKPDSDGGPAFPMPLNETTSSCSPCGMTLRDYFAAAALAGLATQHETLLANHDLLAEFGTLGIDKLQADIAYRLADAMIAERSRQLP